MGCDYYLTTELVIEYNNYEKTNIILKTERGYIANDDTIQEAINKRYYSRVIYDGENWLVDDEYYNEFEDLYIYVLQNNNISLYNVKTITKVINGYRR
jgi:hypothetical protein